MAARATCVLLLALGSAPFQCSSQPDPSQRMEETPGQALYELAEQFRARGELGPWETTLRRLMDRYPASRFAKMAKQDLRDAGKPVPADDD